MRKILLNAKLNSYKANLHCHTNISDGKLSPAEVKALYKARGYSVVAFTDHDVLIPHPELNDDSFLALNGYEIEVNGTKKGADIETCHICLVALEPDNLKQVCWHREKYLFGNAPKYKDLVQFYEDEPDFERSYNPDCINEIIKRGREKGFFVTYNHPTWSTESYPQYINYHGMHAMEICNYSCVVSGFDEHNSRVYDDMLKGGEKIYCIAADDNHNRHDDCGGYIVIKAEKLDYKTITDAMLSGSFYASTGPEIKEIYCEDGKIFVKTSEAKYINFNYNNRRAVSVRQTDGKLVTEAEAPLYEDCKYVRITVADKEGEKAYSNAYFIKDLL